MADPIAKELFNKLQVEHGLDPTVTAWLTAPGGLGAKTLDDLLCACTEDGVENLVKAAKPVNIFLATSRLRQAWRALKRARDDEDVVKRAITNPSMWMTCSQPQSSTISRHVIGPGIR